MGPAPDQEQVFANIARTFLKVTGAALITVLVGITSQKTLHGSVAIGVAGFMAAVSAGIAAIVVFVPDLSLQSWLPGPAGYLGDAFLHGFLSSGLVAAAGWFAEPNYATWHAVWIGIAVGAFNAGFRAVQAFFTPGEAPAKARGVRLARPLIL